MAPRREFRRGQPRSPPPWRRPRCSSPICRGGLSSMPPLWGLATSQARKVPCACQSMMRRSRASKRSTCRLQPLKETPVWMQMRSGTRSPPPHRGKLEAASPRSTYSSFSKASRISEVMNIPYVQPFSFPLFNMGESTADAEETFLEPYCQLAEVPMVGLGLLLEQVWGCQTDRRADAHRRLCLTGREKGECVARQEHGCRVLAPTALASFVQAIFWCA